MADNLIEAADAIRASVRNTRQLLEYADALEQVGALDQAVEEAKRAANAAREEAVAAKAELAQLKEDAAAAKKKAKADLANAETYAANVVAEAQEAAAKVIVKAKEEAAVVRATADADAGIAKAQIQAEISDLQTNMIATSNAYKEKSAAIVDKQKELERLDGLIEKAKAQIATLLNA